jgi:hypothetical protein
VPGSPLTPTLSPGGGEGVVCLDVGNYVATSRSSYPLPPGGERSRLSGRWQLRCYLSKFLPPLPWWGRGSRLSGRWQLRCYLSKFLPPLLWWGRGSRLSGRWQLRCYLSKFLPPLPPPGGEGWGEGGATRRSPTSQLHKKLGGAPRRRAGAGCATTRNVQVTATISFP